MILIHNMITWIKHVLSTWTWRMTAFWRVTFGRLLFHFLLRALQKDVQYLSLSLYCIIFKQGTRIQKVSNLYFWRENQQNRAFAHKPRLSYLPIAVLDIELLAVESAETKCNLLSEFRNPTASYCIHSLSGCKVESWDLTCYYCKARLSNVAEQTRKRKQRVLSCIWRASGKKHSPKVIFSQHNW